MHYLYRIINQINGKIYIGQSINPDYRWYQHRSYASKENKQKQYIHRAMAKYGIDNFIFEVIVSCLTQEDATEIENILISQYDSRNQELGYNLVTGAHYGGHSEETKEKQRQATIKQIETQGHPATGRIVSESEKELHRKSRLENPLDYTPEIRQRMSEAHIGIKDTKETKKKKSESIKLAWEKRQNEMIASGELKCNAPDCEISGINEYLIVNNIRYCEKHGQRLKRTGSLEIAPLGSHAKGKKLSEETKNKCGLANIGRAPVNKIIFTEEEIGIICNASQSIRSLSRQFKVTEKVIVRMRKENSLT